MAETGIDSPSAPAPARVKKRGPLPPTEDLLTQGGDARIVPDADRGLNRYGCRPFPDPEVMAFGSSTSSIVSAQGFAAADRLRDRILSAARTEPAAVTYERETARVRRELMLLCGVADTDADVVLAASGTDLHLFAAQLAGEGGPSPTLALMVDPQETGAGVSDALSGLHFSSLSPLGRPVVAGTRIPGAAPVEIATVPMRVDGGSPRSSEAIDADAEARATAAAAAGWRVLLVVVDGCKTGGIAPSPACALRLKRKLSGCIDVLVDACQFRIAPSTLRAYLRHDFMVALTGSKFLGGPSFCGALLIPASSAPWRRRRPLSPALSAYSARADWPSDWGGAKGLDPVANFGLILRWEAALQELRAFRAVPEEAVAGFLRAFAHAVDEKLASHPLFDPLSRTDLDRRPCISDSAQRSGVPFIDTTSWDQIPTIFPFLLVHPEHRSEKVPLSPELTSRVYQLLQADLSSHRDSDLSESLGEQARWRCHLGQPVACGHRADLPLSALRLCASARLVVEGTAQGGRDAALVLNRALAALDRTAMLAARITRRSGHRESGR